MELFPAGLAAMALWALLSVRDPDRGLMLAVVLLPLGMLAVARLPVGGVTPLAAHAAAGAAVALLLAGTVSGAVSGARRGPALTPVATIPLALLCGYAAAWSILGPRLFADAFDAFQFGRGTEAQRISPAFRGGVAPVGPSAANLSQTAYLCLSAAFFIACAAVVRRRGTGFAIGGVRAAALVNLGLGLVDAAGLSWALDWLRTADYALLDEHAIAGVRRLIGGFPEASSLGAFSAAVGAFLLAHGLAARRAGDAALGLASCMLALAALSTTAFVGLAALALGLAAAGARDLVTSADGRLAGLALAALAFGLGLAALAAPFAPTDALWHILDRLVLSKAETASGLERGAMAEYGWRAFVETGGLGAGPGAVRANGLPMALLSSVGVPGAVLFALFLWKAMGPVRGPVAAAARPALAAARIAGFAHLAMMSASGFQIDPGLLFMVFAAVGCGARAAPADARAPGPAPAARPA